MRNSAFAVAAAMLALTGSPARADVLPQINAVVDDEPPYSFELRAPGVVDFVSFAFDLILTTNGQDPASFLTVTVDRPPAAAYSFGAGGEFSAVTFADPGTNQLSVHIEGSTTSEVNTMASVNDLLASVRIVPAAGVTDEIRVSVRNVMFELNEEVTSSVQAPRPFTIAVSTPPVDPAVVPAPAAWVSFAVGGLLLAAARRTRR